jgi:hypothetical protein
MSGRILDHFVGAREQTPALRPAFAIATVI